MAMKKVRIKLTEQEIKGRVGKELQKVAEKTNCYFEIFLGVEKRWCMNDNAPDGMKQFAKRVKVGYITPKQIEIFTPQIADGPNGNGYYNVCIKCKRLYQRNTSLKANICNSCDSRTKVKIREYKEWAEKIYGVYGEG